MSRSRVWISIFILLVIALHAVPLASAGLRKRIWPFLEWGMYKGSRPPGPIQTVKKRIIGVTSKGEREAVTPDFLGSSKFALQGLYELPMWRGDSAAAQKLFRRLNVQREDPFVELRLESVTYMVTDTGVARKENPAITYHVTPPPSR
jgi:hypothetical protein